MDPDPAAVSDLSLPTFTGEAAEGREMAPVVHPEVSGKKAESGEEFAPFVMSESLPVVPSKLVKRIVKGDYVDMAKLLKDNLELERRRCLSEGEAGQGLLLQRSTRREISDLLS